MLQILTVRWRREILGMINMGPGQNHAAGCESTLTSRKMRKAQWGNSPAPGCACSLPNTVIVHACCCEGQ